MGGSLKQYMSLNSWFCWYDYSSNLQKKLIRYFISERPNIIRSRMIFRENCQTEPKSYHPHVILRTLRKIRVVTNSWKSTPKSFDTFAFDTSRHMVNCLSHMSCISTAIELLYLQQTNNDRFFGRPFSPCCSMLNS